MNVRRGWTIYLLLFGILLAACLLSLLVGDIWNLPRPQRSAILQMRLARILLAMVAGAGLSVSGVIFQALLRNPLAEPYVLGVSSGAGVGAAVAVIVGLQGAWGLPATAFAGALLTIFIVYALARTSSGVIPVPTLLLSGVIVGAVLGSILMFLVSLYTTSESSQLRGILWWLLGSCQIFDLSLLGASGVAVAAGLAVTILFARDLNLMTLGEEPATHLGLHVEQTKKLFFLVASLMTGAAVAACGVIGFVGLIVPHTVRLLIGPDHRRLVPASALAGAAFLVLADLFARNILGMIKSSLGGELPIGVVTAFLGGPFFLFVLRRRTSSYWR